MNSVVLGYSRSRIVTCEIHSTQTKVVLRIYTHVRCLIDWSIQKCFHDTSSKLSDRLFNIDIREVGKDWPNRFCKTNNCARDFVNGIRKLTC